MYVSYITGVHRCICSLSKELTLYINVINFISLLYLSTWLTSWSRVSGLGGDLGSVRAAVRLLRYTVPTMNANISQVVNKTRFQVLLGSSFDIFWPRSVLYTSSVTLPIPIWSWLYTAHSVLVIFSLKSVCVTHLNVFLPWGAKVCWMF